MAKAGRGGGGLAIFLGDHTQLVKSTPSTSYDTQKKVKVLVKVSYVGGAEGVLELTY